MRDRHPLAGKTVRLKDGIGYFMGRQEASGQEFEVEDWAENVLGESVWFCRGNPAALEYAMRLTFTGRNALMDDDCVYGKVGMFAHIVHDSEIVKDEEENTDEQT